MTYPESMDLSHFEEKMAPRGSQAEQYWGAKDVEAMFPGEKPTSTVPFPRAARRKDRKDYDEDLVTQAIQDPADLSNVRDIDPRHLSATQPGLTRQGVDYYMGDEYNQTGRTFAEQGNVGNQIPVVYSRRNEFRQADWQPEHEHMLLSGHHRASAALLQGRQFKARHIEGGYGPPR